MRLTPASPRTVSVRSRSARTLGLALSLSLVAPGAIARSHDDPPASGDAEDDPPAQAGEGESFLDRTVVTATQTPRSAMDTPYTTTVLTEEDFLRQSPRTTPRMLLDTPGVLLQETSHGQGSPYIRGFTGFRNVLEIDGIRLNNSVFRDGPNQYWNTVDPFSISRLEVVKGPSSVLHGSDAIGGTVAATVRRPTFDAERDFSGRLHKRLSSAERSVIVRVDGSVTSDDTLGVRMGGTLKSFGDLRGGEDIGTQHETGYDEWDADLLLERFLEGGWELVFGLQKVKQDEVPRTHRTIYAEPFRGTTVGSDLRRNLDQERTLVYAQLVGEDLGGTIDEAHVSISWHDQREERDRVRGSGAQDFTGFDVRTLGVQGSVASDTDVGRITVGVDSYYDVVDSFSSGNPIQGPVADEATYHSMGVFVQDEVAVGEEVTVVLGTRYNRDAADADSVADPTTGNRIAIEDDWDQVVGSARFVWRAVQDALHVFGGVSQGFRAPNLSDLTRLDTARTNELEVPSPGLKPETFTSYEIGVKSRTERTSAQLSCFYTAIDDSIVRFPTGVTTPQGEVVVAKANVGDGYVSGIEVEGTLDLTERWGLRGNGTYMNGKVDTFPTSAAILASEYIDRLMPLTLRGAVTWEEDDCWAEAGCVWADDADRLSTRDRADTSRIPPGGTPGYLVFDIRTGVQLGPHCRVDVGLENLFDEDYRIHGSGLNAPGRSLVLGLTLTN